MNSLENVSLPNKTRAALTTEQLNNFLTYPERIDIKDLELIRDMKLKYPFSPIFAALYAKGLHNVKDLSFDEELRKAAMLLPDRSILYQLIYKEVVREKIIAIEKENAENVIDQELTSETVESPEVEEVRIEIVRDQEEVELEKTVILEAINHVIQQDVDELLNEEISDDLESWKVDNEEIIQPKSENDLTPKKFSDWLLPSSNSEKSFKQDEKKLLSSRELIDKFISSKNTKIDVSKDPLTPKEMGNLSLVEDDTIVTETLAEIYAKQGKYEKAIKIYELLSLKIPEKKTFFASRIRFLKEKMEYDN